MLIFNASMWYVAVVRSSVFALQCDEFIKKYSKEIIDALLNGATPKVLCSLLKLCLFSEQKVVVVAEGSGIVSLFLCFSIILICCPL